MAALIFRLVISPLGFHVDILSLAGWGQWIFEHGTKGFYENSIWIYSWPTQPPFASLICGFDNWFYITLLETFRDMSNLIVQYHLAPGHMRWFFTFTKWFDTAKTSSEAVFSTGYLVTVKLPAIAADIGIAALIYKIAKNIKGIKYPAIWPAIYLFSPFSFYISAFWGQYDQLAFLPLLIAFLLESGKKLGWLTPFLMVLSITVKPTGLILIPLFAYLYIKNNHPARDFVIGGLLIVLFYFFTTQAFTNQNIFAFSKDVLYGRIFFKAAPRLSANAFNFWRIFIHTGSESTDFKLLFIPAYICSWGSYILFNVLAIRKIKKINVENVATAIFVVGSGSFLFMTGMLDRYFFAGIVSGLIAVMYNRKLFVYWLILSLIFAVNLYNQSWFPEFLNPLREFLLWQDFLVTKILSVINILIFLRMLVLLLRPKPASEY